MCIPWQRSPAATAATTCSSRSCRRTTSMTSMPSTDRLARTVAGLAIAALIAASCSSTAAPPGSAQAVESTAAAQSTPTAQSRAVPTAAEATSEPTVTLVSQTPRPVCPQFVTEDRNFPRTVDELVTEADLIVTGSLGGAAVEVGRSGRRISHISGAGFHGRPGPEGGSRERRCRRGHDRRRT